MKFFAFKNRYRTTDDEPVYFVFDTERRMRGHIYKDVGKDHRVYLKIYFYEEDNHVDSEDDHFIRNGSIRDADANQPAGTESDNQGGSSSL